MFAVLRCINDEHDLRLVVLAALICVGSVVATLSFYRRVMRSQGGFRAAWLGLAGMTGGCGVFATHFIAMLAYQPSLNIHYDVGETVLSLVVAVAGITAGATLATWRHDMAGRAAGGAGVGLSIGAMHYIGMAALRMDADIIWRPGYMAASILIGVTVAAAAFAALSGPGWRRLAASAGLLVVAIVGLHFTAMTAVILLPDVTVVTSAALIDRGALALIISGLALLIVLSASAVMAMERFARASTLKSLRAALDAVPSGIAFFDRDDRLTVWNQTYGEMMRPYGVAPAEGLSQDEISAAVTLAGGRPEDVGDHSDPGRFLEPLVAERALGDGRWMRVESRPTPIGGTVVILTDTTEQNTHANALAEARDQAESANRAKTEFLANMSHEMRTPLNGVLGIAEVLSHTPLKSDQKRLLGIIRESSETLDALLGDVLDLARLETGTVELAPQWLRPSELVASLAALFREAAEEKGLAIVVEASAEEALEVEADPRRLRQILTNLTSNAVKFTERGQVTLAVRREGQVFRFEVKDTGVGFDPAGKARMFQSFGQADSSITRRHGGAGLGLALCQKYAALMGGAIECDGAPGAGSTFTLVLDLPLRGVSTLSQPEPQDAASDGMKVLIVDDNAVNRQVLELILAAGGLDHASVEDGQQAVEAFKTGQFEAVLMDIQMPVMDGLEATRRIRQWEAGAGRAPASITIVSANCLPEHVEAGRAAGADNHLAKPVTAAGVLTALMSAARAA